RVSTRTLVLLLREVVLVTTIRSPADEWSARHEPPPRGAWLPWAEANRSPQTNHAKVGWSVPSKSDPSRGDPCLQLGKSCPSNVCYRTNQLSDSVQRSVNIAPRDRQETYRRAN